MTSKISSRKFLRAEMIQSRWLLVLVSVVCIFLYPLTYAIRLSNEIGTISTEMQNYEAYTAALKSEITFSVLGLGNVFSLIGLAVAAVLAAAAAFGYLDSREKTDFYHSLAMKRSTLFRIEFAHGWLTVIIPYLISVFFAYAAVGGIGSAWSVHNLAVTVDAVLVLVFVFTTVYSVCILGFVLTGRAFTGILVSALLLGYGPICYYTTELLIVDCFDTFLDVGGRMSEIGLYLSPVTAQLHFMDGFLASGNTGVDAGNGYNPKLALLLIAAYLLISLFSAFRIFVKRKSETAGEALISARAEQIIKVMISIPAGIVFGLLLTEVFGMDPGDNWFALVFAVIGAFLVGSVIEVIFTADLRSIAQHWISLLISIAGAGVIAAVFVFDLIGYDSYFPEEDQIRSMAVLVPYEDNAVGESYLTDNSGLRRLFTENSTEDFSLLYEVAKKANQYTTDLSNESDSEDSERDAYGEDTVLIYVQFELQNGGKRIRSYQVTASDLAEYEKEATRTEELREEVYHLTELNSAVYDYISIGSWNVMNTVSYDMTMTREESEALWSCLKQDFLQHSMEELEQENPTAVISFSVSGMPVNLNYVYYSVNIYDDFDQTWAWLEEQGIHQDSLAAADRELPISDDASAEAAAADIYEMDIYDEKTGVDYVLSEGDRSDMAVLLANMEQVNTYRADARYRVTMQGYNGYYGYCSVSISEELHDLLLQYSADYE